jgi:hypothetical protein
MSGPIVRTGTTPEFWKNWDRVFGGKSKSAAAPAKPAKKTAAPKAAKKTTAPKKGAKRAAKKK